MAVNSPNSPRQKMINLMYLVFIAMLALNVSSEVLNGFELVEESLRRSVESTSSRNKLIFGELETYHHINQEKTQRWYDLAEETRVKSDTLFNYIQNLKLRIVKKADGKDGDPTKLKHPDDLNASEDVMLLSGKNEGKKLKSEIDGYREYISSLIEDPSKKTIIESNLSTIVSTKGQKDKMTWEQSMFKHMPLAASVTLLTKLQNDIRSAEGEALATLLKNIDVSDFRVNRIKAYVIPESKTVMRGSPYTANIVLSAEDSTQLPRIFVNGQYLSDDARGLYRVGTGSSGSFTVKGFIEMSRGDGSTAKHDFSSEYFVVEPSATIAPVLMNVLYSGISNDIRIAVPGVANQNISANISAGSLTPKGDGLWATNPPASAIGTEVVITVTSKTGGPPMTGKFRVRRLPDPTPYLEYRDDKGNLVQFKRGRLSKSSLAGISELKAAIDDGILNIPFPVVRFETLTFDESLGTAITEASDGKNFSSSQKERIRQLNRGKVMFIRKIVVRDPGGTAEREVSTLDITIN